MSRIYKLTDWEKNYLEKLVRHYNTYRIDDVKLREVLTQRETLTVDEANRLIARHRAAYPALYGNQNL
jgi:hypothetical protein